MGYRSLGLVHSGWFKDLNAQKVQPTNRIFNYFGTALRLKMGGSVQM